MNSSPRKPLLKRLAERLVEAEAAFEYERQCDYIRDIRRSATGEITPWPDLQPATRKEYVNHVDSATIDAAVWRLAGLGMLNMNEVRRVLGDESKE